MSIKIFSLEFENSSGERLRFGSIDGTGMTQEELDDAAIREISCFCEDKSYKIPYIRYWVRAGTTVFDVGSHTEFFYLTPTKQEEEPR